MASALWKPKKDEEEEEEIWKLVEARRKIEFLRKIMHILKKRELEANTML